MRRCLGGLLLLLILCLCDPVQAQGTKDLSDLLPAETLACLELRHPERLSREVAALIKGSALENLPAVMARFRASTNGEMRWQMEQVGVFGLFLSPEMISEAGRIGGGAVALTGFSKDGTPHVVGLIQTGDSNLVGLYTRAFITLASTYTVGESEGVPLFRMKERNWRRVEKKGVPQPPPELVEQGPFIAQLPGLVILGSSADTVKDVIRRAKGKSADPSLSNLAAYRRSEALRDRPGLFAHANLEALAVHLDQTFKSGTPYYADWLTIKAAVNPAALRGATASLSLSNGNLELSSQVQLHPGQKSPLLDLLSAQPVKLEWLKTAPQDSALALTVNLGGQQFLDRLLAMVDTAGKARGLDPEELLSKKLADLEEALNLKLGKDVFGKISGATLILTPWPEKEAVGLAWPTLALNAVDAESARYLEETALPRLARSNKGAEGKPEKIEVQGLSLLQFPAQGIFQQFIREKGMVVGRRGNLLVLSPGKEAVVAALLAAARNNGLVSREKVAAAIKGIEGPIVLGVGDLGALATIVIKNGRLLPLPDELAETTLPEKVVAGYKKAMTDLPPLVLNIQRKPEQLSLSFRQPALRPAVPRILDLWIEMALARLRAQMQPGAGKGAGVIGPAQARAAALEAQQQAQEALKQAKEAEEARRRALEEQKKKEGKP